MKENVTFQRVRIETPVGSLVAITRGGRLVVLQYEDRAEEIRRALGRLGPVDPVDASDPGGVASALRRYLAGDLVALDTIEVDLAGTPFQKRVWAELRKIPAGTAIAYGELACRVGDPKASRAVAGANGANPVAVVVPCHRVVAKTGALWGYGGGLERKRWLLAHEGVSLAPDGGRVVRGG